MNNSNILKNLIICYIIFVSSIIGLKLYPINCKGKKIMSLLEAGMMVCFGASWPFQVVKTYKSKEVKGKSIHFLWLVEIGYVLGMLHHILYAPDTVIYLYLLNFILVGTDMILYYKYKKLPHNKVQKNVKILSKKEEELKNEELKTAV